MGNSDRSELQRLILGLTRRLKKPFNEIENRVMFSTWLGRARPVLVYQMGKVGSTSIGRSLTASHPGISLNTHDFFGEHRKWIVRRLYRAVQEEGAGLDVVTLTREPVGRNVSAFFENYERDTGIDPATSDLSVQQLRELFLSNYRHDLPLTWFEDHIEREFGIDVYQSSFPDQGHDSFEAGNVRLLVMRSEESDATKEKAIRAFLDLPDFRIVRANVGDNKEYAGQYQEFKSQVRLPADYVDRMCSSHYFTHFYPPVVIDAVRNRWSEKPTELGLADLPG